MDVAISNDASAPPVEDQAAPRKFLTGGCPWKAPIARDDKRTGVYAIKNRRDGKLYVGSAAGSFKRRWRIHRSNLLCGVHHSPRLQAAWDREGAEAFTFLIISYCDPEWCKCIEQIYINKFRSFDDGFGYNIARWVHSPSAGSPCRDSTKRKISAARMGHPVSDETRKRISIGHLGKKHSLSHLEAIRAAHRTPEARERMSMIKTGTIVSLETREKLRKLRSTAEFRAMISRVNKGRKHTQMARDNMRNAQLKRWSKIKESHG